MIATQPLATAITGKTKFHRMQEFTFPSKTCWTCKQKHSPSHRLCRLGSTRCCHVREVIPGCSKASHRNSKAETWNLLRVNQVKWRSQTIKYCGPQVPHLTLVWGQMDCQDKQLMTEPHNKFQGPILKRHSDSRGSGCHYLMTKHTAWNGQDY